jgi:hypothetical protein
MMSNKGWAGVSVPEVFLHTSPPCLQLNKIQRRSALLKARSSLERGKQFVVWRLNTAKYQNASKRRRTSQTTQALESAASLEQLRSADSVAFVR